MRRKITIEESVMTHQDSFGQPFFAWQAVCSVWATFVDDGLIIKHTDKVRPNMRALEAGRIMVIGKVSEFEDGGQKFLKLSVIDSVRGDTARTRTVPEALGAPSSHDQARVTTMRRFRHA
jgi:hypothetical protein